MMQQDLPQSDYKVILKEELAQRCRTNPRYSLRAFARDLKLAPSRLSEILSGKQGLSRPAAERIARALGYPPGEIERFCDLVEAMHARSKKNRDSAKLRLKKLEMPSEAVHVQHDTFRVIGDWYHFAILELTNCDDFRSDAKWIARRLGISEFEVQLALDRLTRLNLISLKGGKIQVNYSQGLHYSDAPSETVHAFYNQLMSKAREALVMRSHLEREFGADIIAIDKSRLPELRKAVQEIRNKFCKTVEDGGAKDGLYCFSVQFFELGEKGSEHA
jgi:uncharacterized protein (TIGR02147 family)